VYVLAYEEGADSAFRSQAPIARIYGFVLREIDDKPLLRRKHIFPEMIYFGA